MKCHAMLCTNDAVGILMVRILFRGTVRNYEYYYCANDLPFFKEKMESHGYIVEQFDLEET